ncbi:UNVERIFIED_ORG: ABC-type sugar transport system substrate-binding protein [Rhizobium esperanzae]
MIKLRRLAATVSIAAIMTCAATAVMAANIFVVGGKPDDPFWSIVKRGAEDAGKVAEAQGGKVASGSGRRTTTISASTRPS